MESIMKTFARPLALAAVVAALPLPALAQTAPDGPFSLPELEYEYDALEPVIDAQTMELHHTRHHQSFIDNLNRAAAEGDDNLEDVTLEEILASTANYATGIRNSAGGHWNHTFFWDIMAPADAVGEPSEDLAAAIDAVYGSMDEFKAEFEAAGAARFGSGWVWLIVNDADQLEITTTPNQDNPLMDVAETPGTPIIGNDVWEHAYYLTYNNRRADYLTSWWGVLDWAEVSERYAEALAD